MEMNGLLERCKKGDRQALDLLYSQYKPHLLQVCRQYTRDDNVAEDLLHDAFVIILTSLHSVRDAEKLESWMVTIVNTKRRSMLPCSSWRMTACMQIQY